MNNKKNLCIMGSHITLVMCEGGGEKSVSQKEGGGRGGEIMRGRKERGSKESQVQRKRRCKNSMKGRVWLDPEVL